MSLALDFRMCKRDTTVWCFPHEKTQDNLVLPVGTKQEETNSLYPKVNLFFKCSNPNYFKFKLRNVWGYKMNAHK